MGFLVCHINSGVGLFAVDGSIKCGGLPRLCLWVERLEVQSGALTYDSDVIMSAMTPQITRVSIVCSSVGSGADQRKHQSFASLAFV